MRMLSFIQRKIRLSGRPSTAHLNARSRVLSHSR